MIQWPFIFSLNIKSMNKTKLKVKYVTWSRRAHCYHGELTDDGYVKLYYECIDTGKKLIVDRDYATCIREYVGIIGEVKLAKIYRPRIK